MWISRKDYNELVQSRDIAVKRRIELLHDYDRELILNYKLQSENDRLTEEVKEYKQKYADEVQKRLELVKLLENTPLTN